MNEVHELLNVEDIFGVLIHSNYTEKLQSFDLSVNKSAKDYMKNKFHK